MSLTWGCCSHAAGCFPRRAARVFGGLPCMSPLSSETQKRSPSIGLWRGSEETALYIADFIPSAQDAVYAIKAHWGVVGYTMLAMRRLQRRKPQPNQSRDLRETTVVRRQHPPLQRRQNVLSHRDQWHRRLEIINLHVTSVE
jgi:hypothetical protein